MLQYAKRPIDIFQIELTNFCDMDCSYCPHPTMTRPKGHMSAEVLEKCVSHSKDMGKDRVILHHFGESLLHPKLEERFRQVKEAGLTIQFATNGTLLERKLPMMMELDTPFDIILSVHQWKDEPVATYWQALAALQAKTQGSKVRIYRAYNVNNQSFFFCRWVNAPAREWDYLQGCNFLRENWCVVLWNGDMASCCLDCHGESVFSNILMPGAIHTVSIPWRGCPTCDPYASRK
ncbi:MAG: radical SAM protein [Magnetococcales bacterium]|nr:radical SAM protein [Magnetococcales bacterium]NGZ26718.1 radical SAM protein [Magnetococcales bacterium]